MKFALAFAAGVLFAALSGPLLVRAGQPGGAGHAMPGTPASPGSFQALMDEAMVRMDAGMSVAPSGDPDRDFARMMIPHHQGAVDMAIAELTFGRDERLRRLAQGIIVEQRQEIEVMQRALADLGPARSDSKFRPNPR
ncbi:MAG TPA: DUF305 domain-containing protein [Anaeromyxobacteraceae bacterium]|nr:DUF305 domain-containing protein [Anaeromyxobacteraceae bacterium]